MKIKEVCRKTGLTEKAVRYYVENGLVTPEEYIQRGRTYREYSEEDVRLLGSITTLRRIGMSVETIKRTEQGGAAEVMQGYLKDLGSELERKQKLFEALKAEDYSGISGVGQLAEAVRRALRAEPASPNFSQFNDSAAFSDDLRAFEQRSFEREQRRRQGARLGLFVTAAVILGSAMALTSLLGIVLFLLIALIAVGVGSDYVGFYRAVCAAGAAANVVSFVRSVGELTNKNLFSQLFADGRMELGAMASVLYLLAALALAAALALLIFSRPLIEYLSDRE